MAVPVTMPQLGESVTEGTVTRWLKKEGDHVEADEPLLEVSTDKVDTEIPAPSSGVLGAIKVQEDETVEVGVELATIDDGSGAATPAPATEAPAAEPIAAAVPEAAAPEEPVAEPVSEPEPEPEPEPTPAPVAAAPPPPPAPAPVATPAPAPAPAVPAGSNGGGSPYVTPLVRRLAAEHGVDLSLVSGTGVGGRIRKQDVIDAAGGTATASTAPAAAPVAPVAAPAPAAPAVAAPAATPAPAAAPAAPAARPAPVAQVAATTPARGRTEPLSRLRQVIASRMVESLQVSAQLTTVVEADVTRVARLRASAKTAFEQREGVPLTFLPFFALATIEALKQHPQVNASVDIAAGTVTYHEAQHLGIAVDTERGLLVPVLKNAGDLSLAGLARHIADLAERTRTNRIGPDDLGGGTFTLTNTGSRGALFDTPIINQPQVGILGTGAVVKRPAVIDDPDVGEVIAVRSMAYLALTYDHRIVDGADAARFLTTVRARLEEGDFEADLGL